MSVSRSDIPTQIAAVPVAIYTRVSTQHQVGGRFDSCESQASICREYLQRHVGEGWFEAALYSDPAYSGGTLKRPGMEAMMRHIAAGGIKVVLIFKFERVLRSTDEWGPFRNFLKKHNCRLQSPMENLTEETAMDRFQNNLRANLAEFDRYNTAEKVRAKMLEQAKHGFWNCGPVPFGYNYNGAEQHLYPHPEEAGIVARIFREAAELVSLTDLANSLGREGIRTRVRHIRRRDGTEQIVGGKRFRSDGLRILIKNPIYSGRVRFLGKEYAARHEALVSTELWEQANAAVSGNRSTERRLLPDHDKHFHLLKGVLRCEHCERTMLPNASGKLGPAGKPYRYYTCANAQKERNTAKCPVRHVSASCLEAAVVGFIGRLAQHPEIVAGTTASARLAAESQKEPLQKEVAALERVLEQADTQIRNCAEAIAHGGAELLGEELRTRIAALKDQKRESIVRREQARQLLRACEENLIEPHRIKRAMGQLAKLLPALPQPEQKHLVALCFERIGIRLVREKELLSGRKRIDLLCRMRLTRLVDSMEQKVIVHQTGGSNPALADRQTTVTLALNLNSNGTVSILSPFQGLFGERHRTTAKPRAPRRARHPLHRALAWQAKLEAEPRLTQKKLAEQAGVKAATVTYHMNLLRLAPEIRKFLLALDTAPAIRPFGLVRMRELSKLDLSTQRRRFAEIKKRLKLLSPTADSV